MLVILAARLLVPSAPPLYDGVVPLEAYRWLDPPPSGQHGGAKGATAVIPVQGGKSPLVAVATPELEPQAQMLAPPDGLTMPAATTAIHVSIEPIPAEGVPTDGHIDGNVYRFTVTDQRGTPITAPASARVSVVLRAADPTLTDATVERLVDGTWQPSKSSSQGFGGTFLAIATDFGDFAVVAPGVGGQRLIQPDFDGFSDRIRIRGRDHDTWSTTDCPCLEQTSGWRRRPSGLALARPRCPRTRHHDRRLSRHSAAPPQGVVTRCPAVGRARPRAHEYETTCPRPACGWDGPVDTSVTPMRRPGPLTGRPAPGRTCRGAGSQSQAGRPGDPRRTRSRAPAGRRGLAAHPRTA